MSDEAAAVPSVPEPVAAPVLAGPTPSHEHAHEDPAPTPQARQRACQDEVRAALMRHGCDLVVEHKHTPVGQTGRFLTEPTIHVVALR